MDLAYARALVRTGKVRALVVVDRPKSPTTVTFRLVFIGDSSDVFHNLGYAHADLNAKNVDDLVITLDVLGFEAVTVRDCSGPDLSVERLWLCDITYLLGRIRTSSGAGKMILREENAPWVTVVRVGGHDIFQIIDPHDSIGYSAKTKTRHQYVQACGQIWYRRLPPESVGDCWRDDPNSVRWALVATTMTSGGYTLSPFLEYVDMDKAPDLDVATARDLGLPVVL